MKKMRAIMIVAVVMLSLAGCGQKEGQESGSGQEKTSSAAERETSAGQTQSAEPSEPISESKELYEENFAVDGEAVAEFGSLIKEAVAEKDLEGLADLTGFPVYVGFSDGGLVVETREEFIALGAERFFTSEMVSSIAGADETGLNPSMAGFTMYDGDGAPSITFGVRDGSLAISGINY